MEAYNQSTFLILKAAYLYYLRDMPQSEIAAALNVSIPTVSRLIKRAREEKIVEFVIRDPYVECINLEERLETAFGLKDAIIVPALAPESYVANEPNPEDAKRLVALEAARYLQRIIKDKDVLGVTWGSTIHNMINYLNPAQKTAATFVTLHGSIAGVRNELDVRTLVDRMSRAFSGRNYPLLTEGLISSKRAADIIKKEPNIRMVFDMFKNINISISGMGAFYPKIESVLASPEFMSPSELQNLQKQRVTGDMLLRFFDDEGDECETSLAERIIAIDFNQYRKIDTRIIVASGLRKAHALLAATRGGLVNVLVTDYQLGNAVLNLHDQMQNLK